MTPDHPVMLRDGNYIEAQQLKVNDSIMPFYTKLSIEPGIKNYEKIYDPSNNEYEFTHRIVSKELNIDNYNNTKNIVHHQNFVRLDNSPANLNCSIMQQTILNITLIMQRGEKNQNIQNE